ncbi:DUF3221 domain-containing protein [Paenibacillus sp. CAU 1782]
MKKIIVLLVFALVLATGCSSVNKDEVDGPWNYKKGFVVSKEDGRVLVVRDKVDEIDAPLNEILEEAQPDAIWLSVNNKDFNAVSVGDKVNITIPNGMVDQSYPAQASAELSKE